MAFLVMTLVAACGDDGKGKPLVADTTLDFGTTACGSAAAPLQVVLGNDGDAGYTYNAATGGAYVVTPALGYVGPHSQVALTVTPLPMMGAAPADETLTITTDVDGDAPHAITLTQHAVGVAVTASTSTVAFPTTKQVGSAAVTTDVTFTNTGTAATTLTFTSTNDSFSVSGGPAALGAGESVTRSVAFQPLASGALNGQIHVDASGAACGPTLTTSGTGTFAGTAAEIALLESTVFRKTSTGMCVRLVSGHVACMGADLMHQRGAGVGVSPSYSVPNLVRTFAGAPLDQVVQIRAFAGRVCARRMEGSLWCWGAQSGETPKSAGDGLPFADVVFPTNVLDFDVSYRRVCAVLGPNGTVQCAGQVPQSWGSFDSGQLAALTGATKIELNGNGGYVTLNDGTVTAFGRADRGARGASVATNDPPNTVTNLTNVVGLSGTVSRGNGGGGAVGGGCALDNTGAAFCWGNGRHGKNGDGTGNDRTTPVQVAIDSTTMLAGVTAIASAREHRCAIASGNVYCWGRNSDGQAGSSVANGELSYATLPTTPIGDAVQLSLAGRGSCVLRSSKRITCWGTTPFSAGATQSDVAVFAP